MSTKVWRNKKTVVASDYWQQNNEKQARIKNAVAASGDTGSKQQRRRNQRKRSRNQKHSSSEYHTGEKTEPAKKKRESRTEEKTGEEESDSGDIEEQTGVDLGVSMDRRNIGSKKKLLVIPLRGIFVHRAYRSYPETIPRNRRPDFCYGNFLVYVRPYCVDFLKFCFERFNVGLWSSTREPNLHGILDNIMGDLKNKLLFTWDQEHCTYSGFMCLENKKKPLFLKELSHIWEKKYPNLPWSDGEYSASNTLLFTYPEKALLNPPNTTISPASYDPENWKDDLLGPKGELRVFLAGLAEAEDVQTYVEDHPIGDPEITPSHPDWDRYCKIICSINKKRNVDPPPKLI